MIIGGLQRLSLSDFPGRISAIVFTRGCNFRCPWCHNPELVDPERYGNPVPPGDVLAFLSMRKTHLQGVVVTGGEPLLHGDVEDFLSEVRAMGLAVKLDTNGSMPRQFERILAGGLVDYVAMDVKAPWNAYSRLSGAAADTDAIAESISLMLESGVCHEVRTTYSPRFLGPEDLRGIASIVKGCEKLLLQAFRPSKVLEASFLEVTSPTADEMEGARRILEAAGVTVLVR